MKTGSFLQHLALVAIASLCLPAAALAADFTCKVETSFVDIHQDINRIRILCWVFDDKGQPVGSGHTDVNMTNKSQHTGSVSVSFNADSGKDPSDGKTWKAYFQLFNKDGHFAEASGQASAPKWRRAKPSPAPTLSLTGNL